MSQKFLMSRAEHIRHVFALFDAEATLADLIAACVHQGVFTQDEVQRRGVASIRATCARALRAKDPITGVPFAIRLPRQKARAVTP